MGNFTFSEIITIIIVILIVFGPQRLPEIARKAGALASKARAAVDSIRTELDAEYGEVIQPLREARDEMRTAGAEVRGQITAFGKELEQTGKDVKQAAEKSVQEPVQGLRAAADKADDPAAEEPIDQAAKDAADQEDEPVNQIAAANAFPPPGSPEPANGTASEPQSEAAGIEVAAEPEAEVENG